MSTHAKNARKRLDTLKASALQSKRYPFIAEHRGGPLTKEQHRQLMHWACQCIERVLPLFGDVLDERLVHALDVAKAWEEGNATVGEARKAACGAIDTANAVQSQAAIAVARGVGHAVATAHMADHAPGGAEYALKALACVGRPIEEEREWQNDQLPEGIKDLVLYSRAQKSKGWEKQIKDAYRQREKQEAGGNQ